MFGVYGTRQIGRVVDDSESEPINELEFTVLQHERTRNQARREPSLWFRRVCISNNRSVSQMPVVLLHSVKVEVAACCGDYES